VSDSKPPFYPYTLLVLTFPPLKAICSPPSSSSPHLLHAKFLILLLATAGLHVHSGWHLLAVAAMHAPTRYSMTMPSNGVPSVFQREMFANWNHRNTINSSGRNQHEGPNVT